MEKLMLISKYFFIRIYLRISNKRKFLSKKKLKKKYDLGQEFKNINKTSFTYLGNDVFITNK